MMFRWTNKKKVLKFMRSLSRYLWLNIATEYWTWNPSLPTMTSLSRKSRKPPGSASHADAGNTTYLASHLIVPHYMRHTQNYMRKIPSQKTPWLQGRRSWQQSQKTEGSPGKISLRVLIWLTTVSEPGQPSKRSTMTPKRPHCTPMSQQTRLFISCFWTGNHHTRHATEG